MLRIVGFLVLIAALAAGAAWIADQSGDVAVSWGTTRIDMSLPVFVLLLGIAIVAAMAAWSLLRGLWRTPARMRHASRERRHARGRRAITQGLLAIGHGDNTVARRHADDAQRYATHDPLTLLLHAQSAQLDGNREGAQRAFRAMAEREDTRLLGLRGLFIEAQRADDALAAVTIAEEALKLSPGSTWASHAVLGFRCAQNDWAGALTLLDNNLSSGLLDKAAYRRQRGVLLAARAIELERSDRDLSRESVMEAVKLAPTLIPAAALAGKFFAETHQTRRAMRVIEDAWKVQPHPDLADAYAHVRLGDSARQRLVRTETLAAKAPDHIEGALAIARAAIDASEFARARDALAPFIATPTQRVAMLMAEIERTEHGDSGRARAWTLRAVRARHDPVWTADGYVADRWRPVSPVTGRLDAFQWQTPLAALPSTDGRDVVETSAFEEAMLAPPAPELVVIPREDEPLPPAAPEPAAQAEAKDESKDDLKDDASLAPALAEALPKPPPPPAPVPPPPVFRARTDIAKDTAKAATPAPVPPVIPIVRAPDDPGVDADTDAPRDEFTEQIARDDRQAGGWRGFISRLGG